jgi:hypothetical protein
MELLLWLLSVGVEVVEVGRVIMGLLLEQQQLEVTLLVMG